MRVAILIPAYNEALSIGKVVQRYQEAIPEAKIYVGDNNSTDDTSRIAKEAGASVMQCTEQGKGNAIRVMLSTVDADVYLIVDGDDTYSARNATHSISLVQDGTADLVIGSRVAVSTKAFSLSHKLGNKFLTALVNLAFGLCLTDLLSGYRVINKAAARCLGLQAKGFELEAELTIRAAHNHFDILEVPISYRPRLRGSMSKLRTWRDGLLIFATILSLFKEYEHRAFFVLVTLTSLLLTSVVAGIAISLYFPQTPVYLFVFMIVLVLAVRPYLSRLVRALRCARGDRKRH